MDICAACSKSSADVKGHLANVERKKKRDASKEQATLEKGKIDAAAKLTLLAAERARAGMDAAADKSVMPSLFRLILAEESSDVNDLEAALIGVNYLEDTETIGTVSAPVTHPILAGVDTDNIAVHRGDAALAKAIKWFGGKYSALTGYEQDGRCQFSLQAKKGLDAVENILLATTIRIVDIAEVSPGFMKSAWLCAFKPGQKFCGLTPNQAGMIRVLQSGCIFSVLVQLSSTVPVLVKWSNTTSSPVTEESIGLSYITKNVQSATLSQLNAWRHVGADMRWVKQGAGESLYIPMGWCVFEMPLGDGPHIAYRKSFIAQSQKLREDYILIAKLLHNDGANVDRLDSVSKIMDRDAEVNGELEVKI